MALVMRRLDIEAVCTPGEHGQFDVLADGERIATRGGNWITPSFGAGYPDLDRMVDELARHRANHTERGNKRNVSTACTPG